MNRRRYKLPIIKSKSSIINFALIMLTYGFSTNIYANGIQLFENGGHAIRIIQRIVGVNDINDAQAFKLYQNPNSEIFIYASSAKLFHLNAPMTKLQASLAYTFEDAKFRSKLGNESQSIRSAMDWYYIKSLKIQSELSFLSAKTGRHGEFDYPLAFSQAHVVYIEPWAVDLIPDVKLFMSIGESGIHSNGTSVHFSFIIPKNPLGNVQMFKDQEKFSYFQNITKNVMTEVQLPLTSHSPITILTSTQLHGEQSMLGRVTITASFDEDIPMEDVDSVVAEILNALFLKST